MGVASNITDFFAAKRIAVIGVSRDPRSFSHTLYTTLRERGRDVIPVNPNARHIGEHRCFPCVQDVAPPVEAALIIRPFHGFEAAARDCVEAGIRLVWIHGHNGPREVNESALRFLEESGARVIPGYCPFMFLPKPNWLHKAHAWILRCLGWYPR